MQEYTNLKSSNTIKKDQLVNNLEISSSYYNSSVHIGHRPVPLTETKPWHPSMAPYQLGIRKKITISNVQQTKKALARAFYVLTKVLENGGSLLIVNTNPAFYDLSVNSMKYMEKNLPAHSLLSVSHCFYKWVGGTLTNYKQISKSIYSYLKFSQRFGKILDKYKINFPRYEKVQKSFQGYGYIVNNSTTGETLSNNVSTSIKMSLQTKPDIIFLFNPGENQHLIREANRLQIPIIACTDSSSSSLGIAYPIPGNNGSIDFNLYLFKKIYKVLAFVSSKKLNDLINKSNKNIN